MKKYLIIIILFSTVALWPFAKKGFFISHDGEWMIIRFTAFHQTLSAGQFPVRFVDRLYNGYGYPVLNFLYPLPFYISEIWKLAGFGFVDSVKITFVFSTLASSLAMFWALSQIFPNIAAVAGSIVYLFAPYRFVDLYVRGSIGENVAFAFIPLVLGSIFKISKGQKIYLPTLAASIALLILSHNVIAFLFLPIFLTIAAIQIKSKRQETFLAIVFGLLISAFFWIPAIFDTRYVRFNEFNVATVNDHLVNFSKLIIPQWGFGPNPNSTNPLPVQIGIISLAIFFLALIKRLTKPEGDKITNFFLIIFLLSFFLMTNFSAFIWVHFFEKIIQFPWRLLSVIVFASAYLASYLISQSSRKLAMALFIILTATISTITYSMPQAFIDRPDSYYATNEGSTTVQDEYLPIWVKNKPQSRAKNKIEIVSGEGSIDNINIRPSRYKASINSLSDITMQANTFYFPGWVAKADGQTQQISYQNENGLINFKLPKGQHEVIIYYNKTPVHLASEMISFLAIIATCASFIYLWRKQNS